MFTANMNLAQAVGLHTGHGGQNILQITASRNLALNEVAIAGGGGPVIGVVAVDQQKVTLNLDSCFLLVGGKEERFKAVIGARIDGHQGPIQSDPVLGDFHENENVADGDTGDSYLALSVGDA